MRLDLIPRSKAVNAYELLDDVVRAIEAEPKRFFMNDWLTDCDHPHADLDEYQWEDVYGEHRPAHLTRPDCGTIGCIAGWTYLLDAARRGATVNLGDLGDIHSTAMRILIGSQIPGSLYRTEIHQALHNLFYNTVPDSDVRPQTPEYVAEFVGRIRAFQRQFEPELRARALAPTRTAEK